MSDRATALRTLKRGVNAMDDMAVPDFIYEDEWEAVREAARRWSEFPTDEDVEAAMVAMANTKAGFDPPHYGMDELARAALEAVRARETGETPQ